VATKLNFGILLPTRGVILAQKEKPDLSPIFDMAQTLEESGYHSLWVGDSVTAKPRLEVFTTLSALAVKTKSIKTCEYPMSWHPDRPIAVLHPLTCHPDRY